MLKFIISLLATLTIIYSFYAGTSLFRTADNVLKKQKEDNGKASKQSLAKDHRRVVGISNSGTSMDNDSIYLVTDSELGISE